MPYVPGQYFRRRRRRSSGGMAQDDLLRLLGEEKKPRAGILERLLAMPSAVGSIPDIIYRAQYKKEDPLAAYLGNIGEGLKTTFLGQKDETPQFTTSDILKKSGAIAGTDLGSRVARGGIGFVGDVLLDPMTYMTFGTGALAKGAIKGATKGAAKGLGKKVIGETGEALAKKGLRSYGFKVPLLGGKSFTPTTKLGKGLGEALRFTAEPFHVLGGAGSKGLKRLAPGVHEKLATEASRIFDYSKFAKKKGLGGLLEKTKQYTRAQQGEERKIATELGDIAGMLKKQEKVLPTGWQQRFGDIVEGATTNKAIPNDLVSAVRKFTREKGQRLSDREIISNLKSGDYFPRIVKGFKEDFIKNKFGKSAGEILSDPRALKELSDPSLGHVTTQTLSEIIESKPTMQASIKGLRDPKKYLEGSALERSFDTVEEGAKAGVVYNDNALENLMTGGVRANRAIRAHDFAQKLDTLTDDAGQKLFYKADDITKQLGRVPLGFKEFEIKGMGKMVAPKEAVNILKNYTNDFFGDEGMSKAVGLYDKILSMWKKSVTGLGPGFVGYNVRNALGDTTNMILDGFRNPKAFTKGAKVLQFESFAKKNGIDAATKKFGKEIGHIYKEAMDKGILQADIGQLAEEAGVQAGKVGKGVPSKLGKVGEAWKQVATVGGYAPKREELSRLAHFVDTFERTKNWDEAGKAVRRTLFDYSDLTPTERGVFKRVVPFYTYMRKNFEFHLNNYAKRPGKYTTFNHLVQNVKNMGAEMSPEEWDAMPEWMKGGMAMAMGRKGDEAKILTGFGLPTEAVTNLLGGEKGPRGAFKEMLSSMSPALKVPLELATGKLFFSDKPIIEERYGGRYRDMPAPIKKLLGYREKTVRRKGKKPSTQETVDPYRAYLLSNAPMVAPFLTQYKRILEAKRDPVNLVNLLSGGRIYTRNIEQEKESRKREKQKILEQLLFRKGMGGTYKNFYLSPQEKKEIQLQLSR